MRLTKTVLVLVLALAGLYVWLRPEPAPEREEQALDGPGSVLINRIWIDRMPTQLKDKLNVFVVLEEHIGVFQNTSAFEGDFAVFSWVRAGRGKLSITMLQSEEAHQLGLRITTDGCGEFDYCMRVSGAPRGARHYVSRKDWVVSAAQLGIAPGATPDAATVQALVTEWLATQLDQDADQHEAGPARR